MGCASGRESGVVGFELGVELFQIKDSGDAGEVDPALDQIFDPPQAFDVVVAVAASAPVGACRGEQSASLVKAQGLRADS